MASSLILKWSSTASVLGSMLSKEAKMLGSGRIFFLGSKKASAFRRCFTLGIPTEPDKAKAIACFMAADFMLGSIGDFGEAAITKSHWNCAGEWVEHWIQAPVGHNGAGKDGDPVGFTGVAGTVGVVQYVRSE
jgi:hypothetical protein